MSDSEAVLERLIRAQNAHDLEGMLECFHADYLSEQPAHPARTFRGSDQVRTNWSNLLESIPDFSIEVLRTAIAEECVWVETRWRGTKTDGTPLDEIGVAIFGVREGRIAWARLYVEEIEQNGGDIDSVVRQMAGTEE